MNDEWGNGSVGWISAAHRPEMLAEMLLAGGKKPDLLWVVEGGEEIGDAGLQGGVDKIRGDVGQGFEHKASGVEFGMGDLKLRGVNNPVVKKQDVEVHRPRRPLGSRTNPAEGLFNSLQVVQQAEWSKGCFDFYHAI